MSASRLGAQPRVGAVDGHGHRHARGAGDGVAFPISLWSTRCAGGLLARTTGGGAALLAARRADGGSPAREAGVLGRRRRPRRRRGGCPSSGAPFCLASRRSKQTVRAEAKCGYSKLPSGARGVGSEGCLLPTGGLPDKYGLVCLDTLARFLALWIRSLSRADVASFCKMDAAKAFLDANHLVMDVIVVTMVVAALHRNYLHKAFTIGAGCFALSKVCEPTTLQYAAFALVAYFVPPLLSPIYKKQPETGAVFVTGADSGMGEATVLHLCKKRLRPSLRRMFFNRIGKEAEDAARRGAREEAQGRRPQRLRRRLGRKGGARSRKGFAGERYGPRRRRPVRGHGLQRPRRVHSH